MGEYSLFYDFDSMHCQFCSQTKSHTEHAKGEFNGFDFDVTFIIRHLNELLY